MERDRFLPAPMMKATPTECWHPHTKNPGIESKHGKFTNEVSKQRLRTGILRWLRSIDKHWRVSMRRSEDEHPKKYENRYESFEAREKNGISIRD